MVIARCANGAQSYLMTYYGQRPSWTTIPALAMRVDVERSREIAGAINTLATSDPMLVPDGFKDAVGREDL